MPATLAQRLLACDELPAGIVDVLADQAGIDPITESGSLPAAWTPAAAAERVATAPAPRARALAQLKMTNAQYEAVVDAESRISVLRALISNRRIRAEARTCALVKMCRLDPTLSNLDLSGGCDSDQLAERVLADPVTLAPLSRLCSSNIVERALADDPTGTSLVRWARAAGPGARSVQGLLRHSFPSGNHLDLDDEVLAAVFTPGTDYEVADMVALRNSCRRLYHDADLSRGEILELLDEAAVSVVFTRWASGRTAARPRPGDIRAAVAADPGRARAVTLMLQRYGHDDCEVAELDWADELLGAQSVGGATNEYQVPRAAAAAMAARLGDDPVAWMAACEIAPRMLERTIDELCDAALLLAG